MDQSRALGVKDTYSDQGFSTRLRAGSFRSSPLCDAIDPRAVADSMYDRPLPAA